MAHWPVPVHRPGACAGLETLNTLIEMSDHPGASHAFNLPRET
jgi:hypothetical protein